MTGGYIHVTPPNEFEFEFLASMLVDQKIIIISERALAESKTDPAKFTILVKCLQRVAKGMWKSQDAVETAGGGSEPTGIIIFKKRKPEVEIEPATMEPKEMMMMMNTESESDSNLKVPPEKTAKLAEFPDKIVKMEPELGAQAAATREKYFIGCPAPSRIWEFKKIE